MLFFNEYPSEVVQACRQYDSQRPWSKRLQDRFLNEYVQTTALQLPNGFNYKVDGQLVEPRLMQRHVAAFALERRRLLVMSDMGTGKSLAAQLAVKADGAQRVLVIAINSCVAQWVYDFEERWRGNTVQLFDMDSIRALTAGAGPSVAQKGRTVWVVPSHLLSLMKDQEVAAVQVWVSRRNRNPGSPLYGRPAENLPFGMGSGVDSRFDTCDAKRDGP